MAIDLSPEELFETTGEPDESGFTAPPGGGPLAPEPAPARYEPAYDPRIDSLQQTVNALLARPQPQPVYYPAPQQQQQEGWKAHEFMSKEDAMLLLTSQDPAAQLNKVFNNVAQQLYTPMAQEMAKRDQILLGMHNQQQQYQTQQAQVYRAQTNQQTFYGMHPDLANPIYSPIVAHEAQALAYESQRNPAAFINATDQDVYNHLAQRVAARVEAFRGGGESTYTPPVPARQSTFMEKGSGARQGGGGAPDTNTKALREMTRFMRNGK